MKKCFFNLTKRSRFLPRLLQALLPSVAILASGQAVADEASDLLAKMTLEEKIGQMLQVERLHVTSEEITAYSLGSILSGGGSVPTPNAPEAWHSMIETFQQAALKTRLAIPLIYGIDAVHGNSNVAGATLFPHNIGLGAANNPTLMAEIGRVTAEELLATGITWTFSPCVAVARDARWGRYFESFGETPELVSRLLVPYVKAMQDEYKVAATIKHFAADGGTTWGTGSDGAWGLGDEGYKIDQGNAIMSEDELRKTHIAPYVAAIKAGAKSIMISYSSWNGVKNHQNKYLITDVLKNELNFKGFIVSDWEGTHQINAATLYDKTVIGVNAGIDMLMEPKDWKEIYSILLDAVKKGDISMERIDDAVTRILKAKFDLGLFEKPLGNSTLISHQFASPEHVAVAEKAVRESLVLLKNEGNILPLAPKAKVFVTGPAANNVGLQNGGWTIEWQGTTEQVRGTTILEGFKRIAAQNGGTIITDNSRIKEAEVVVVVIGEQTYAEGIGDDEFLALYNGKALPGNLEALDMAKKSQLPTIVVMVSGRPRIITNHIQSWQAFVQAWYPGSEGGAVADVLYGFYDFTGKLPISWPRAVTTYPIRPDTEQEYLFPRGFGLKMN